MHDEYISEPDISKLEYIPERRKEDQRGQRPSKNIQEISSVLQTSNLFKNYQVLYTLKEMIMFLHAKLCRRSFSTPGL